MSININSASSVIPLVRQLGLKDIRMSPVPGTVMDRVVNSVSSVEPVIHDTILDPYNSKTNSFTFDDNQLSYAIINLGLTANTMLDNITAKAIAEGAETLANKGEEIIAFVRNEVVPTLNSLTERTVTEITDRKMDGIHQYIVKPDRPADIFFTEFVQSIMLAAAPRHNVWGLRNAFKVKRYYGPRLIEDLLILLRTDHPGLNVLIEKAVDKYGEDAVQNAYDIFFNGNPAAGRTIFSPDELRNDHKHAGERLFAILLSHALQKDPPEGVNITLDSVNNYFSDVIAFCGSSLERYIKNYTIRAEKKFLDIHRSETTSDRIVFSVNDEAYAFWVSKGLTDTAILGSMLSDGNRDAEKIMEKQPRYEDEWKRQEVIIARAIETNTATAILNAIRFVIHQHAKSVMGDNYLPESGKIDKKLNEIFESSLRPRKDEDIYKALREAVLCIFYPDEGVCVLLKSLDEIIEENPSMDPRQAAGLAFIDLGVSWLLSQICIS